ncbi:MAG: hypothetical protein JWO86_4190 [Myxococcaceae bacterium]|nr:hypothetical protein [Myxococcaceae bacterium]
MAAPLQGLTCPTCGAGLGEAQPNGERICSYCGQRALPDPAVRRGHGQGAGIDFNAVFAKMDEREKRERERNEPERQQSILRADYRRVLRGEYAEARRAKTRSDVLVCYVLMGVFMLIGIVCVGVAVAALAANAPQALPIFAFAAFWLGMSLMFFAIARQSQKRGKTEAE